MLDINPGQLYKYRELNKVIQPKIELSYATEIFFYIPKLESIKWTIKIIFIAYVQILNNVFILLFYETVMLAPEKYQPRVLRQKNLNKSS